MNKISKLAIITESETDTESSHLADQSMEVTESIFLSQSMEVEQIQTPTTVEHQLETAAVDTTMDATAPSPSDINSLLVDAIHSIGFDPPCDLEKAFTECITELCLYIPKNTDPPTVKSSPTKSWFKNYTALSFLMNGQLFAEYERVSHMLSLPSCSRSQWLRIVEWTERHVTELAEWSCEQVRNQVRNRGDHKRWVASYDGFYLTRGHYSNNSSGTLHDYITGSIAWFTHRTKRGKRHNWEGTSNGAEGNMFDELLKKAKDEGFVVSEIVTDKDTSGNAIFCNHFPEGSITYCSNHSAKTLHKELQNKIKTVKCKVRIIALI